MSRSDQDRSKQRRKWSIYDFENNVEIITDIAVQKNFNEKLTAS